MKPLPSSVVIIGGGVGGLAVANILAQAGVKVDVYEQYETPGGRAGQLELEGFRFDTGPSWYLMPEVFEHYFELLGKKVGDYLTLERLDPAYKVFFQNGQPPLAITANAQQAAAEFEAREAGAGGALKRYLLRSQFIYELAVKYFLYNPFQVGRWFLSWEIIRNGAALGVAAFMPLHAFVKRYIANPNLQQTLEYPMVFLGTSPFKAPAIYSLMSHMDFNQGVFFPKGGMYKIVEALMAIGQSAGVTYHFGQAVTAINVTGDRTTGITLADGTYVQADAVVSNADLYVTETKLLPEAARSYPESSWHKRTASPSAILLYLGVYGELPELEHHNLLFAEAWEQNFADIYDRHQWPTTASMYVSRTSATDPTTALPGHENLFVLVPGPATNTGPDNLDALVDQYLDQLASMIEVPNLRQRIVVQQVFGPEDFRKKFGSWQGSALGLAHTLEQSALFRPSNQSRRVKNLYYVGGSTTPGIGLPTVLIGAELVYKRMIGDRTAGALPVPMRETTS